MNKTENKFNFKALLTLLTALVLSLTLCLAVACGGNSSESNSASGSESTSESTSEVKDPQTIANGNFEYNISDSATFPYTSGIKWTRTYGTSSSDVKSGIVDTTKDDYKDGKREGSDHKDGETEGKYVLMLKNNGTKGTGTSQYFTSSTTVTLEHGKDALLSVWVKTVDVKHQYSAKTGAYVQINNTVGTSIAPTVIDNIDTKGEWVQYKVYLRGSNFAVTKFQVVLGLGHGDKNNQGRLCEGTAYFDDVNYEVFDANKDYDKINETVAAKAKIDGSAYKKDDTSDDNFIIDNGDCDLIETAKVVMVNFAKKLDDYVISGAPAQNFYNANKTKEDEKQYATDNGFTATVEGGKLKFDFTGKNGKKPEFGTSYTFTSAATDLNAYNYKDWNDNESENDYKGVMITFKAKVDVKKGSNGAFVKIIDSGNEKATDALTISTTDGEKRYAIYLTTNKTGVNYKLQITFGPTSASMKNTDFPIGTAEFYDFKYTPYEIGSEEKRGLTEWEFANAETTDAATLTLLGKDLNDNHDKDDDDTTKDSYSITTSEVMTDNKLVCLGNVSGSTTYKETNLTAGLVNSKYSYTEAGLNEALSALKAKCLANVNNSNKNVQAIALIKNGEGEGYVTLNETNVPANSTYKFSVKLRVASGEAFVRLYDCGVKYGDRRGVAAFKYGDVSKDMTATVTTSSTQNLDGYTVVTFIVKTGNAAKNYKLQVGFSGTEGLALLGEADKGSSDATYADADAVENAFADNYSFAADDKISDNGSKKYYYKNEDDAKKDKNRVQETGADGKTTDKYLETDPTVVYLAGKIGENKDALLHYYRYDTIDAVNYVIESATDSSSSSSSSSDSTSTDNTAKNYVWLQIISVVIAIVLIAVLVAIIVRSILKNKKSKITKTKSYYNDKSAPDHKKIGYDARKYSTKTSGGNKHNVVAPDDNAEYNYDEAANSDEATNEKEATEETTEATENTDTDENN